MAYDLATARIRTGTTVAPTDAEMQNILDTAMSFAERYCSRFFKNATYVEEFRDRASRTLQLRAFPEITSIDISDSDGKTLDISNIGLDEERGIVYGGFFVGAKALTVTYEGGYVTLPLDLELALWSIFDNIYGAMTKTNVTGSVGGISSVTLADVGTVKYNTSGSSGSSDGYGYIPMTAEAILNLYTLGQA